MKHTKKLLSILLALIFVLSCATVALAWNTPDFNWTPIPTSPDGLQPGDVYLDFTPEFANANTGFSVEGVDYADCMSRGNWYVDCENNVVRGSYELPPDVGYEGNVIDYVEPTDLDRCYAFFYGAVREVGVEWQEVKLTADNLQDGDWYLDADAAVEAMIAAMVEYECLTPEDARDKLLGELSESGGVEAFPELAFPYGLFVYPGKTVYLIKCIVSESGKALVMNPHSDNPEEVEFYYAAKGGIKQYKAPVPEKPVGTERQNFFDRVMERIRDIIRRLGDFFKRLIRR